MKARSPRLSFLALLLISSTTVDAATWYVDDTAVVGLNNGTSWSDAYVHLQDALAVAQPGDQVWVAEGTYRADLGAAQTPGDRAASFVLQSGVEIYGSFVGFETSVSQRAGTAEATVLSGDLNGDDGSGSLSDNTNQIVIGSGVGPTARLDGFTITGGNAVPPGAVYGGGIWLTGSSPVIAGCRIIANRCTEDGGGMTAISGSSPTVIDCEFIDNVSGDVGGGIWTSSGSITILNTVFIGNDCGRLGGAIYYFGPSSGPSPIVNCVFSGNTAVDRGGVMYVSSSGSAPALIGCSASSNSAGAGTGGVYASTSTEVRGCVLYGNSDPGGSGESAQVGGSTPSVVAYSCIGGLTNLVGPGNTGADPMFTNALGLDGVPGTVDDDLTLQSASPCLDAGDSSAFPADAFDLDADLDLAEPIPVDVAGAPRFFDDPSADVGNGPSPIADMGAYERGVEGVFSYGQGCVGSGGFTPTLALSGVPAAGSSVSLSIANALGGSTAVLLLGTGQASVPIGAGCFLNVAPVLPAQLVVPLAGVGPGNGSATLFGPLPPGSSGITFTMQAFVAEPGLPKPYANTKGLQMTIQ